MVGYCTKPNQNHSVSWNKVGNPSRIVTATKLIFLVQILRDLSNLKDKKKKERVASRKLLINLRILTISATKQEDKESRKQLKQGSKNTFLFSGFVNLRATMS